MRRALASLIDVLAILLLIYLAFRVGMSLAGCANPDNCFVLTPGILVCIVLAIVLYFGVGWVVWETTLGRKLFSVPESPESDEEV